MQETSQTLEERVAVLEHEIREMKSKLNTTRELSQQPWWEKLAGTFKSDPLFDEVVEAGRAYRRSLAQDEH